MLNLFFYIHFKVFIVLNQLCNLPIKFSKQQLAITHMAVTTLKDNVAGVHKNVISLIVK